jgi:hypothetical protein
MCCKQRLHLFPTGLTWKEDLSEFSIGGILLDAWRFPFPYRQQAV